MNEIEAVGGEAAESGAGNAAAPLTEPEAVRAERPWIYGLLIAPSAVVSNGIIQGGVLAYIMRQQGISGLRASQLISLLSLPTMIYFLWSPLTDFLVRRRTWLLLGGLSAGVLTAAALIERNLASRSAVGLMFLGACCSQLVVSSCGGMMGAMRVERAKRIAGSFYQGGSLAFGAASVFVLVLVYTRADHIWLAVAAAILIAGPALMAVAAPRHDLIVERNPGETLRRIWDEFKSTFLRWRALPYTLLMVFPLASGSAVGLLPGIAQDYGVNGQHVAWMNGLAGALLMAAGSLTATLISARIRASVAYLILALVNAATLAILWLGPQRPATYFLGVTLYLFTVGTAYAMFTAVVLEFLGSSGKSGSGRYSIINSLGNVPVVYMLVLDGWGGNRWGPRGLSGTEAVAGAVAASILLIYFLSRSQPVAAAESPAG
jgi:PAT family beta-lactamase induction signal transducer AmpG